MTMARMALLRLIRLDTTARSMLRSESAIIAFQQLRTLIPM